MANIINMGGGSISPVLLASLTSVPTSGTAISGTETWKKYDAIYFECFVHFTRADDKAIFTNLILTDVVSPGERYFPLRTVSISGAGDEASVVCVFSENGITLNKVTKNYDVTKVNIYGADF